VLIESYQPEPPELPHLQGGRLVLRLVSMDVSGKVKAAADAIETVGDKKRRKGFPTVSLCPLETPKSTQPAASFWAAGRVGSLVRIYVSCLTKGAVSDRLPCLVAGAWLVSGIVFVLGFLVYRLKPLPCLSLPSLCPRESSILGYSCSYFRLEVSFVGTHLPAPLRRLIVATIRSCPGV
jgi:hypothetical protein